MGKEDRVVTPHISGKYGATNAEAGLCLFLLGALNFEDAERRKLLANFIVQLACVGFPPLRCCIVVWEAENHNAIRRLCSLKNFGLIEATAMYVPPCAAICLRASGKNSFS